MPKLTELNNKAAATASWSRYLNDANNAQINRLSEWWTRIGLEIKCPRLTGICQSNQVSLRNEGKAEVTLIALVTTEANGLATTNGTRYSANSDHENITLEKRKDASISFRSCRSFHRWHVVNGLTDPSKRISSYLSKMAIPLKETYPLILYLCLFNIRSSPRLCL